MRLLLAPLWQIIRQPASGFAQMVEALGGYTTSAMGRVLADL